MAIEGFTCRIKVIPVEEWVQQENEERCNPCLIKPLAERYLGTLEDAKADKQINHLQDAWESGDVLTIARAMDKIKSEVGETLKQELIAADCFTQSYED